MMNYFKFFTEVWRFFKKYYNRPGKEQDYTESVQECSQLAKSFGNGDFVDRVCIAVLEELERCWKGREEEEMAVIGIIVFCGGIICAVAWLLNRAERPKDPEEDREQEEYLTEWSRNHGKNEKSKVEK